MVLGGLAALTSLAVASVSVWLVPPYLAVMALLLLAPGDRRKAATVDLAGPHSGRGSSGEPESPESESEIDRSPTEQSATLENEANDSGSSPLPSSLKTKRGKGRGRKGKVTTVELPSHATWVRIGPGKFVRTEMLSSRVEVEVSPAPSDLVGEPTGVSALVEPDAPSDEALPRHNAPVVGESTEFDEGAATGWPCDASRAVAAGDQSATTGRDRGDGELEDVGAAESEAQVGAEPPRAGEDTEPETERVAVAGEDVGVRPVAIVQDAGRELGPETVGLSPPTTSDLFVVWPRGIRVPRVGSGATFSGRINRSGRTGRTDSGARPHARRNALRFRQACRTFPPRSPPAPMR